MRLPPKSYFHLTEIAKCWEASTADLACYTLDGLLEISVMAIGARVVIGWLEIADNGVFRMPEDEKVLNGPQPVISSDLWSVFRGGSAEIVRFKPIGPNCYCELAPDTQPILITLQDLLVTRAERDRLESKNGLLQPADPLVDDTAAEPAFFECKDYAEVFLHGEVFRLGLLQAAVVRELHQASRSNNPWRLGKTLLTNANAQTLRMVDLFKAKPNWRTLIASDGRGYYRLNLPNHAAPRPSHRAYRRFGFAMAS